jgi:DNA-binding FadR family transcriptional regulator
MAAPISAGTPRSRSACAKRRGVGTYRASLAGLAPDHALVATLDAAQAHASDMAELFSRPLDTPEALAAAANRMTADDPAKLLSLTPLIEALEADAAGAEDGDWRWAWPRWPARCAPMAWAWGGSTSA